MIGFEERNLEPVPLVTTCELALSAWQTALSGGILSRCRICSTARWSVFALDLPIPADKALVPRCCQRMSDGYVTFLI